MRIPPDDPSSSYLVYGAGVAARFQYGLSGFVTYQPLGGYDDLDAEMMFFGLRWETTF